MPITADVEDPELALPQDPDYVPRSGPFIKAASPRKGKWFFTYRNGCIVQWIELEGIAPEDTAGAQAAARDWPL